ncbi:PepSY domain-containing protein [Streptomyces sp. NPDC055078]
MKRKIVVAVAVAALLGGGAYTAVAASGDDPVSTPKISVSDAVDAALKEAPGSVLSVGRDDDGEGPWEVDVVGRNGLDREVRVDAKSGKVSLAPAADDTDGPDDADDADDVNDSDGSDGSDDRNEAAEDRSDLEALRAATVDADRAAAAALSFRAGTVTEVEFDEGHWEVEVRAKDGSSRDVHVDARTGKASPAPAVEKADDADDKDDKDDDGSDD